MVFSLSVGWGPTVYRPRDGRPAKNRVSSSPFCLPLATGPVQTDPPPWQQGRKAPVAQLDRVLPSEGRGRTFESSRARQNINGLGLHGLTHFSCVTDR